MLDSEKRETSQFVLEEVIAALRKITPHIASSCEGKSSNQIEKIINNAIEDALDELYLHRYKQYIWNATKDIIVNIEYVNERKKHTTRKIKVEQIRSSNENTSFLIEAYCYLRKMHRSFKADNIQTMYYENGEIITINDLIQQMKEIS